MGLQREVETPNIKGTLKNIAANSNNAQGEAALFWSGQNASYASGRDPSIRAGYDPYFDASKSSSVYSGTELQPPALQVLACIRT